MGSEAVKQRAPAANRSAKTCIAIVGPTASGKTETALEVGALLPIEIISADARQIYRRLTIGTAKPSQEILAAHPHHYIDICEPDEYYSAGIFGDNAAETVQDIIARGRTPVIVGGSGLYIRALCEGLFESGRERDTSPHRQLLEQRLAAEGIDVLYGELKDVDPPLWHQYNDRNPRRIIRALEYYYAYGTPLSVARAARPERAFSTVYYGIDMERNELYERINTRAQFMFDSGLVEETRTVLDMGYPPTLNSLNTVGYKECIAYLNGCISLDEALRLTMQKTRNYAKRQLTWFRRNKNIDWLKGSSKDIAKVIVNRYFSRG